VGRGAENGDEPAGVAEEAAAPPLEVGAGGAFEERVGEAAEGVAEADSGVVGGEPVGPGERLGDRLDPLGVGGKGGGAAQAAEQVVEREAVGGGPFGELVGGLAGGLGLGRSGVEGGGLGCSGAGGADPGELPGDLTGPFRELVDHAPGDADEVGEAVVGGVELDAEAGGEFVAEPGVVDVASGAGPGVEGGAVERPAPSVDPFSGVGDQVVGV
jgi:hypothetical protein